MPRRPLVEVPPNLIPADCEAITPEMLPLVELTQAEIDGIVQLGAGRGSECAGHLSAGVPCRKGFCSTHLMAGEGDPYLLCSLLAVQSRERLDAFLEALQAVIERHDILRTAVVWEGLRGAGAGGVAPGGAGGGGSGSGFGAGDAAAQLLRALRSARSPDRFAPGAAAACRRRIRRGRRSGGC